MRVRGAYKNLLNGVSLIQSHWSILRIPIFLNTVDHRSYIVVVHDQREIVWSHCLMTATAKDGQKN